MSNHQLRADFSGSEDGQVRSAGEDDDFLSDDDQNEAVMDSLDIKPPQAVRSSSSHKRSFKEKKHSRDRKRKDRDRDRNKDRERMMRDREKERFDDRRHRAMGGGGGGNREWDRHPKRHERRDYNDLPNQREHEYHHAHQQHKMRERDKRQMIESRDRERIHERERRKHSAEHYYESKVDAERALEDLRTRLLSKRHKYEKEISRYTEDIHHFESRPSSLESRRERERERRTDNIEIIDSPEQYPAAAAAATAYTSTSYRVEKKEKKDKPEDPELAARRARLLEAERQISRQKEELEARRVNRERNKQTVKRHHDEEVFNRKHKKTKQSPIEEGEYEEKEIIKVPDNDSDAEVSSDEERFRKGSASESDSGSGSVHSVKDCRKSAEDEDLLPGSPLSVGDLAKSEHGRSSESRSPHSVRSRSRSRSDHSRHSRSPQSKSKSHSRTKSRSRSSDRSVSKSRSRSRSQSRSRSRSRSHSASRSNSRSRSRSRTRSPRSGSRSRSRSVDAKNRSDDDVEMKDSKSSDTKKPESIKPDDSPVDEKGEKLPNYFPGIQGCRSVEEFQCLNRIEEGTYGVVYRARDRRTNEIVALKRLKMEKEKEGFPITSLREINTLLKGQHPNIVTVREIVVGSNMDKIFIVMDYVEHDLKSLMETMKHKEQTFFPGEIKCLMQQLLRAVGHLHDNWILHRDLKTSNLLLSHKGVLKVGDFGLAREYGSPLKAYTSLVVTLWYRAPELLLCTKEYSTPIDIWSVGCIFGEFLQMAPLFPGKSEMDELNRIFKELGTPNEKIWPGYKDLPAVQNLLSQNSHFTEYPVSNLRRRFASKCSELGISLLQGLLTYDPKQRLTAEQALKSPYFKELPLPIDPSMFPTWPAKSELGTRKALASSPKPPSGGSQFKQLGRDDIPAAGSTASSKTGFVLNANIDQRQLAMAPGFSLKF